jgi:hypothetical protein
MERSRVRSVLPGQDPADHYDRSQPAAWITQALVGDDYYIGEWQRSAQIVSPEVVCLGSLRL